MSTTTVSPATAGTSDDFAMPIYMDEPAGQAGGQANGVAAPNGAAPSPLDTPVLNLDDPNLLLQEVDYVAGVDPYAAPPPLPDGRWLVKVKQRDVKGQDGQPARYKVATDKQGTAYAFTALDATVIDPSGKFDGVVLTDYFVSTRADSRKGGAIPLAWILSQLKVQLPARITARTLLDEFFKATAGEPRLEVDTVWEGLPDQADQERFDDARERLPRVLGQHRFPQNGKGEAIPDMDVDTKLGKVHLHARPRINGYFAVGSGKASGIELGPKGR